MSINSYFLIGFMFILILIYFNYFFTDTCIFYRKVNNFLINMQIIGNYS